MTQVPSSPLPGTSWYAPPPAQPASMTRSQPVPTTGDHTTERPGSKQAVQGRGSTRRGSYQNPEPILISSARVDDAVARLDAWLETIRGPEGYGGPVVHWWQQSLMYTGAGLDWRYEGIIAGYLHLWKRTGDKSWLFKAQRAGDDLVAGQLANSHFTASAFEINPASGGTPHEAACDAALLMLAIALQDADHDDWEPYVEAAERNLFEFYIKQLWQPEGKFFQDSPVVTSFVPNKAASVCDALFLLTELTGDDQWVERYALPTIDQILAHQVHGSGLLDGAIAQNTLGSQTVAKFFPLYIARCIPALLRGYRWSNNEELADSAWRAMGFITRWGYEDGSFPTVIYANQQVNRYPSWVAPLGDILRAADEMKGYGFHADFSPTLRLLLSGQDLSGGIQTAQGFAAQTGGEPPAMPDVRDTLHVAGWCDKAFRYLASKAGPDLPPAVSSPFEVDCIFRRQVMHLTETPEVLEISQGQHVVYRWRKGEHWPEVATPKFWIR